MFNTVWVLTEDDKFVAASDIFDNLLGELPDGFSHGGSHLGEFETYFDFYYQGRGFRIKNVRLI